MARGKGVSLSTVLLILVLLIGAGIYLGIIKIPALPGQIASTTTAPSELVAVQRKIQFSLVDPLAGSAIPSATVKIYKGTTLIETLTTDSSGVATSSQLYSTGDQLYVYVEKAGYVKRYIPVQVPAMNALDAQAGNMFSIPLQTYTAPTVTLKITDQFGNTYASGGKLNFTALGQTTVSITVTIYNTQDNSGFIGSRDILNNVDWRLVHYISTTGTLSTIQGFERSAQRGTTMYYFNSVPDDALTRQKVGQTYVKTGVYSLTFTVGKGGLAAGQSETYNFYLMMYADVNNFVNQGIFSYDAVQLASFSLVLAA